MGTNQDFIDAVKGGNFLRVKEMLARDPALTCAKNQEGVSVVLLAIYYGEPAIAEALIDAGVELDIFDASAAGKAGQVKELLDEEPTLANAYATDGFQPLGLASFFGHKPVVDLLLSRGAAVNSASRNAQKVTPLHSAVAGRYFEIARTLLEHGADVNAKQADDFTPLHEAAQNGQPEMVRLLLSFGADKAAQKSDGQTALSIALERGDEQVARLLKG